MGDTEVLMEVIERTRKEMRDAQDAATRTPRPADACPSHDALFALTKAQTNALDTLLMLKQEDMREDRDNPVDEEATAIPSGIAGKALMFMRAATPYRWPVAIAVFSPFASDVTGKVLSFFAK